MVFANIFVKGWIVYPYVYNFFDQPHKWIKNILDTPLTEAQTRLLAQEIHQKRNMLLP